MKRGRGDDLAIYVLFTAWAVAGLVVADKVPLGALVALVGNLVWLIWLARAESPPVRLAAIGVLLFSLATELVATAWLDVFHYAAGHVPAYVPVGHAAVFLVALRGARSPLGRTPWGWAFSGVVVVSSLAVSLAGGTSDRLGLMWTVTWFVVVAAAPLARPLLVALVPVVAVMEYTGVALNLWDWNDRAALHWVTSANPPAAPAMGYAFFALFGLCVVWARGGGAAVRSALGIASPHES